MAFEVGEWIQGRTVDGEFIHGYVESMGAQQDLVRVRIVQSDNKRAIGRIIALRSSWLKQAPVVNPLDDIENLRSLIDLALATSDKAWFEELAGRINSLKSDKRNAREVRINGSRTNRLGSYENK